jgi:ABC-type Na+ efflux pump permease subunit
MKSNWRQFLANRVRYVARIARWEMTKNAGGVDRRTLAVMAVALVGITLLAPNVATSGFALDQGLFRVGVDDDNVFHAPLASDSTFVIREPSPTGFKEGRLDMLVTDGIRIMDSQKGRAAFSELRETVSRYNDRTMLSEANQTAAFPVTVTVQYVDRNVTQRVSAGRNSGGNDASNGAGSSDAQSDSDELTSGESAGGSTGATADVEPTGGGVQSSLTGQLSSANTTNAPSSITPPFPFKSLVLAFVFVIPLNFIIQAYGSTILSERLKRRGELLLVSPVSRWDIIAGKTVPYFLGAVGVTAVIAFFLDGGFVSVLAVAPLASLFLSATFVGAMFARSFKDLTFVTVTVTVTLTTYAFVPAIFTDASVALISPLTIVVRDLQGQSISLSSFVFSTTPPLLTAIVLFGLGGGLYREEDMFTQRSIPAKILDAFAAWISRRRSVAILSIVLLPFVFVAELLAVAMLFALPVDASIPLILVMVAIIEEIAKSIHVYAGYAHARFSTSLRASAIVGALSGLGFFVGEKLTLLVQLVGLPDLAIGQAAFATGTGTPSLPMALAFLFAPLVLHMVTALCSAVGASRGKGQYVAGLLVAIVIHTVYNYTVVMSVVG